MWKIQKGKRSQRRINYREMKREMFVCRCCSFFHFIIETSRSNKAACFSFSCECHTTKQLKIKKSPKAVASRQDSIARRKYFRGNLMKLFQLKLEIVTLNLPPPPHSRMSSISLLNSDKTEVCHSEILLPTAAVLHCER